MESATSPNRPVGQHTQVDVRDGPPPRMVVHDLTPEPTMLGEGSPHVRESQPRSRRRVRVRKKPWSYRAWRFLEQYLWVAWTFVLVVTAAWRIFGVLSPLPETMNGNAIGRIPLHVGSDLLAGQYVTGCVGALTQTCEPHTLHMGEDGELSLLRGDIESGRGDTAKVWGSQTRRRRSSADFRARVDQSGDLTIFKGSHIVWSNPLHEYDELASAIAVLPAKSNSILSSSSLGTVTGRGGGGGGGGGGNSNAGGRGGGGQPSEEL